MDLIFSVVGGHPLLLQYFCAVMFERIVEAKGKDILVTAQEVLRRDLVGTFAEPVEEIFFRNTPPLLRYLFLRRCKDADRESKDHRFRISWNGRSYNEG